MNRAFVIVECKSGWCVAPLATPAQDAFGLERKLTADWKGMRVYDSLSKALWHLDKLVKSQTNTGGGAA